MIFYEDDVFSELTTLIQNIFPETSKPKYRFPLLKLPKLVLLECIENLDLLEVTLFSLLSKRTKSVAKLIHWSGLDISFNRDKNPYIWLGRSSDLGRSWIIGYDDFNEEEEEESPEYPYFESDLTGPKVTHKLFLRSNGNAIEDTKRMIEHICEVFRSSISAINIVEQSLIDWIIKFQPEVRYACINDNVITSVETLNRVLKSFKVTEHLVLGSIATDKTAKITEPIPYRSISIWNSYWVTLPAILNGTNSIIRLLDSKLTPMDINTILKEWQMGTKLRNLDYLEIEIFTTQDLEIVSNEAVMNLNLTESDGNDGRPKTGRIYDEYISTLPSPVSYLNLLRSDGMIGSIYPSFSEDDSQTSSWPRGKRLKVVLQFHVWKLLAFK